MKIKLTNSQMEQIANITSEYPYISGRVENDFTPWHWHDELEFGYVVEGEVEIATTNKVYRLNKGEGYFINTNVLASMKYPKNGSLDYFLFHPTFLSGHFRSIFETKYLNPILQNKKIDLIELRGSNSNQKEILKKLYQASLLREEKDTEFQTRNIFSEIWLLLIEEIRQMKISSTPVSTTNQERLLTMMLYIQEHYSDKITLEEIASSAVISTREALRCFQNSIHQTPFEYLISYRIDMAKKLLRSSELSVTEIAIRTGFSNSAYFSKIFKRTCHMTPLAYRKEAFSNSEK